MAKPVAGLSCVDFVGELMCCLSVPCHRRRANNLPDLPSNQYNGLEAIITVAVA